MQTIDCNTFLTRVTRCIFEHGKIMLEICPREPSPTEFLSVFEATILNSQLLMLLLRGASANECRTYAANGNTALPFEGCEQPIFDELLLAMKNRSNSKDAGHALVSSLACWMTTILDVIERDTGVPTTSIIEVLAREEPANA